MAHEPLALGAGPRVTVELRETRKSGPVQNCLLRGAKKVHPELYVTWGQKVYPELYVGMS